MGLGHGKPKTLETIHLKNNYVKGRPENPRSFRPQISRQFLICASGLSLAERCSYDQRASLNSPMRAHGKVDDALIATNFDHMRCIFCDKRDMK
jgi:hypothetical protein